MAMAIQKKSLIGNMTAAKKAIIATTQVNTARMGNALVSKSVVAPKMAKNIVAPKMAKNIVAPKMAKNIVAPKMAKNVVAPKMAKRIG
jgi:hypothetical protein